jgi:hypothetical protein
MRRRRPPRRRTGGGGGGRRVGLNVVDLAGVRRVPLSSRRQTEIARRRTDVINGVPTSPGACRI